MNYFVQRRGRCLIRVAVECTLSGKRRLVGAFCFDAVAASHEHAIVFWARCLAQSTEKVLGSKNQISGVRLDCTVPASADNTIRVASNLWLPYRPGAPGSLNWKTIRTNMRTVQSSYKPSIPTAFNKSFDLCLAKIPIRRGIKQIDCQSSPNKRNVPVAFSFVIR
jgi:hypothetical protein